MDNQTLVKQEEKLKITRSLTGKHGYEFSLLGKPEDNIDRVKELKMEFDKLVENL